MLVNLIKFIHLLFALGILGSTVFCLIAFNSELTLRRLNQFILILSAFALITGTMLVHPKHFTFKTPWIQAAYLFIILFMSGIFFLLRKKTSPWLEKIIYFALIIILIGIVHDAVTKTTLYNSMIK